ncbi:hypothetical protein PVAP13_2NG622700, partial [Panicum virgatum]
GERMYLVDATAAGDAVGVLRADECFPPGPDGKPLALSSPLSARDGLVLVHKAHELRVCNLATGHSQIIPPGPEVTGGHHVLLVGDGGVGHQARPFLVVKARLVLEPKHDRRLLQVQTLSSELGTWGPCTEIRTPQIPRPLVVGGAVHWLCFTDEAGFVLKLRVRAAAPPRLTVTKLPESFPYESRWNLRRLMATMEAGGSPAVLVADGENSNISAWTQSKHTARWKEQPQVVVEYEAILRSLGGEEVAGRDPWQWPMGRVGLEWFAERSGVVLIRALDHFLWLDLRSMKIVRCTWDTRISNTTMYFPCEMLSTWVPTFSSSL